MSPQRKPKDGKREPAKRMIAAGRKIDGVWQVTTFLRNAANGAHLTFWEKLAPMTAGTRRRAR